jgi:lipopolysaccharide transport system ATP-binding protein
VWALKDINFKVEQGDVVGIIGKNGAGKSTLLKLLSRVTTPTTGNIKVRGRIASLLEVGTGFHPEMTGRENIYMNGAILGMTKHEISKKLDEIIDFSGCERYIDTPVKRYSSGMMVRLGFAVAAHLDPEILVVDEVLAVGDAEFQKKAIGKMQDVSKGEGRTVLFVSHNMAAVRNLCHTGIILQNGSVVFSGTADTAIEKYLKSDNLKETIIDNIKQNHPRLNIKTIKINGTSSSISTLNPTQGYLDVLIEGDAEKITNADATLIFRNNDGAALTRFSFSDKRGLLNLDGQFSLSAKVKLPQNIHAGRLKIDIAIHQPNVEFYLVARECCILDIEGYIPKTGQLQPLSSGLLSLTEE